MLYLYVEVLVSTHNKIILTLYAPFLALQKVTSEKHELSLALLPFFITFHLLITSETIIISTIRVFVAFFFFIINPAPTHTNGVQILCQATQFLALLQDSNM